MDLPAPKSGLGQPAAAYFSKPKHHASSVTSGQEKISGAEEKKQISGTPNRPLATC
jgi:hypothetical protein